MAKKQKHYLLAEEIVNNHIKEDSFSEKYRKPLVKKLSKDILKSLLKNKFILLKVK